MRFDHRTVRRWLAVAASSLVVLSGTAYSAPTTGGLASDGVEYVAHVPSDAGGAQQARLVGDFLYVTSWRGFSIYDVSDPLAPVQVSTVHMGFTFPNEGLDTNGEVLVLQQQQPQAVMRIYDVRDKTAPTLIAELAGVPDHTAECVLDCKWVYGSAGTIVDLRDPFNPRVAGDWSGGTIDYGHTISEVAPGRVLTTSLPTMRLLDAKVPTSPRVVAETPAPTRRPAGVSVWPRDGRDRFLLSAEESSFTVRCSETTSAFFTYDTLNWRSRRSFKIVDEFRLTSGTMADGRAPAGPLGCSAHAFDEHPAFRDGGLVALAHYENGTRFLRVDASGKISEVGWFLPFGGQTSAAVWITPEIVYAVDVARGIDILRYTGGTA